MPADGATAALSKREREIVRAVIKGASNKDIGVELGLSEQTIKNQLRRIFGKLGVTNRVESRSKRPEGCNPAFAAPGDEYDKSAPRDAALSSLGGGARAPSRQPPTFSFQLLLRRCRWLEPSSNVTATRKHVFSLLDRGRLPVLDELTIDPESARIAERCPSG